MGGRRYGRLAAGASVLTIAAVVVGAPLVLLHLFGSPTRIRLDAAGVRSALSVLERPPDASTWRDALAFAAWAAWLWAVVCVAVELAIALLGGWRPPAASDLRRRGPGRRTAAAILAPVLLVLSAQSRSAAPPGRHAVAAAVGIPRGPLPDDVERASSVEMGRRRSAATVTDRRGAITTVHVAELDGDRVLAGARGGARAGVPPGASAVQRASSPVSTILVWLAGAFCAVVVEEARRLFDRREVRRLRRAPLAARRAEITPAPARPGPAPPRPPTLAIAAQAGRDSDRDSDGDGDGGRGPSPPTDVVVSTRGEGEVLVRVLGEVSAEGAPGPFDRTKVLESLVYLVLHPDGTPKERWATALWPDRVLSPNSLNTAVWQLRRALGIGPDGERRLPATRSGRLRLTSTVVTDLQLLEEAVDSGEAGRLREAVALVRGRPFDGLGEPDWVVLEGHLSRAEGLIAEAAVALARTEVAAGDVAGAIRALRQALAACPYDERLYLELARASEAGGDAAAAAAARDDRDRALGRPGGGGRPSRRARRAIRGAEQPAESFADRRADLRGAPSRHDDPLRSTAARDHLRVPPARATRRA